MIEVIFYVVLLLLTGLIIVTLGVVIGFINLNRCKHSWGVWYDHAYIQEKQCKICGIKKRRSI